jgi:hypothetical protein
MAEEEAKKKKEKKEKGMLHSHLLSLMTATMTMLTGAAGVVALEAGGGCRAPRMLPLSSSPAAYVRMP